MQKTELNFGPFTVLNAKQSPVRSILAGARRMRARRKRCCCPTRQGRGTSWATYDSAGAAL
eukprot:4847487-Pyramimonas_sp.AAC.1